jgi:hypothetical protein
MKAATASFRVLRSNSAFTVMARAAAAALNR